MRSSVLVELLKLFRRTTFTEIPDVGGDVLC
jgi:hypothetical protein